MLFLNVCEILWNLKPPINKSLTFSIEFYFHLSKKKNSFFLSQIYYQGHWSNFKFSLSTLPSRKENLLSFHPAPYSYNPIKALHPREKNLSLSLARSLSLSLALHKVSHFWALPSQTICPASFTHIHTNQTWVSSISAKKLYFSDTLKLLHSDGCKLSQLLNFPHYIDPPQKNCQRLLLSLSRIWPFKVPLGFLIQNWKKSKRLTHKKKAKLWLVVKSMEVLQTWAFYFKTKGFLVLLGSLSLSGFPALSLLFMVILSTFGAVFVFGF